MYIKTFCEDEEREGKFFPVDMLVVNEFESWKGNFKEYDIYYSVDEGSTNKPFLPLFKKVYNELIKRPSVLQNGGFSEPDFIRISDVDGICFAFQYGDSGGVEERLTYSSLLDAVNAEDSMTVFIDLIGDAVDDETDELIEGETDIVESYYVTFGWDQDNVEEPVFISAVTPESIEEFTFG